MKNSPNSNQTDPSKNIGNRRIGVGLRALGAAAALALAACSAPHSGSEKASAHKSTTAPAPTTTEAPVTTTTSPNKVVIHRSEMEAPLLPTGGDYDTGASAVLDAYSPIADFDEASKLADSMTDEALKAKAKHGIELGKASKAMLDVYSTSPDFEEAELLAGSITDPELKARVEAGIQLGHQAKDALTEYGKSYSSDLATQYSDLSSQVASEYVDLNGQVASIYVNDFRLHTTDYLQEYNNAPA